MRGDHLHICHLDHYHAGDCVCHRCGDRTYIARPGRDTDRLDAVALLIGIVIVCGIVVAIKYLLGL